jgi:GTPase SAR1 family protein
LSQQERSAADFTEQFINQTQQTIFLTGKAGTGKTTLLRKIKESTYKNLAIVAPTGIAALNAGGVTIHSFFQLPFAGFIPEFGTQPAFSQTVKFETKDTLMRHFAMNKTRKQLIRNIELLIIDEVSMLRADLLDAIDWTLRNIRRVHEPFGGVQILFIGDLLQLPPVVKHEEWQVLRSYYDGIFFFHAKVFQEFQPLYIELSTIYRQQDQAFIQVLNNLRNNEISAADIEILNKYVQPDFDPTANEGYITLTTHNAKADEMNAKA